MVHVNRKLYNSLVRCLPSFQSAQWPEPVNEAGSSVEN